VGSALTTMLEVLIITSSFACAMAFYNTSARYLFSLARERIVPASLGRTHPKRHSPYIASMAVSILVGLYILGFTIYDSSTEASLLKLGTWTPLLGVLAQIGACYLLIANRGELAGAGDVFFVKAIPWIALVVLLGGMALALWMKTSAADRFARIGAFEHDDQLATQPARA